MILFNHIGLTEQGRQQPLCRQNWHLWATLRADLQQRVKEPDLAHLDPDRRCLCRAQGKKNPSCPSLSKFRPLFIWVPWLPLVISRSDRICKINFRGGKSLIMYLQPGRGAEAGMQYRHIWVFLIKCQRGACSASPEHGLLVETTSCSCPRLLVWLRAGARSSLVAVQITCRALIDRTAGPAGDSQGWRVCSMPDCSTMQFREVAGVGMSSGEREP